MAENQGIKIRIRLKAYDHKVIDQSAKQIIDTAIRTGAEVAGPIPLPTRRSTYTVVKSPHVYKMGGETYEMYLTAFYNDFTGLRYQAFDNNGNNVVIIGDSKARGLEFEGAWRPAGGFELWMWLFMRISGIVLLVFSMLIGVYALRTSGAERHAI